MLKKLSNGEKEDKLNGLKDKMKMAASNGQNGKHSMKDMLKFKLLKKLMK